MEDQEQYLQLSNNAKRLLQDPMLEGFFTNHEKECVEAFKRVPIGSEKSVYEAIHAEMRAGEKLKNALWQHVRNYGLMMRNHEMQNIPGI